MTREHVEARRDRARDFAAALSVTDTLQRRRSMRPVAVAVSPGVLRRPALNVPRPAP